MAQHGNEKKFRRSDEYPLRTLREIVTTAFPATDPWVQDGDTGILYGDRLPSRVSARFAGATRPLPREKKDVLQAWAQRFAGDIEHYAAYGAEMQFIEDGASVWLAVGSPSSRPQIEGEAWNLYVVRLGAAHLGGAWESLLLVEDMTLAVSGHEATQMPRAGDWSAYLGQSVIVEGQAVNAKPGALLLGDDTPIWIDGLEQWPEELAQKKRRVRVSGVVITRHDLPAVDVQASEAFKTATPKYAGAAEKERRTRFLLKNASWSVLED